jgi:excisionase family DNA binding protein
VTTLDLRQAAALLKMHPQTVRRRAIAGEIPAAKPGRSWVFVEADLVAWLRARYRGSGQVSQGDREENPLCHSSDARDRGDGGAGSRHQTARRYADLLGLTTAARPRSTRTG